MDSLHQAIRRLLRSISPGRAEAYIRAFRLPPEEELFLIECDVRRKSYIAAAAEYNTTPEVIKRRRRQAYEKIVDQIMHIKKDEA